MKKVNFTKMQSLGNDFIIIDNLVSPYNNFSKKEIKKICDRNYGVGCDQLLILKKSKKDIYLLLIKYLIKTEQNQGSVEMAQSV